MNRTPFLLSAIALAVLAGCATEHRVQTAPAPVVVAPAQQAPYVIAPAGTVVVPQAAPVGTVVVAPQPVALRAGFGRIESILAVPNAAAGGTGPSTRRISMRMDDGSMQYFDTAAPGMAIGERIEITKDGMLRQP